MRPSDKQGGTSIPPESLAHSEYFDNFGAISYDRDLAITTVKHFKEGLKVVGLPTHDIEVGEGGKLLGWNFGHDKRFGPGLESPPRDRGPHCS